MARQRGLPDAPPGHSWVNRQGQLQLRHHENSRPAMQFDPTTNNFVPPSTHASQAAVDGLSRQRNFLRRRYLGQNPSRSSTTYRDVVNRMLGTNPPQARRTTNGLEIRCSDGEWRSERVCDLSHQTDAVAWWNSTGRHLSYDEVRAWMRDPDNYTLDWLTINRRRGAQQTENFLPPTNRPDLDP